MTDKMVKILTVETGAGDQKRIREEYFSEMQRSFEEMRQVAESHGWTQKQIDEFSLRIVKEETLPESKLNA